MQKIHNISIMDVSVIIVNYNSENFTIDAIESIINNTSDIDFEIIVIDNASPKKIDKLKNYPFENFRIIQLENNIGFGGANNEALKYATGRNILFLNPDVKLKNNALKILSNYLDCNLNVASCGGNLFNEIGEPTHSYSRLYPSIFKDLDFILRRQLTRIIFGRNAEHNHTNSPIEVAYICGADMMVKKSILDRYGAFDPNFFLYHEECDMAYRLKKLGFQHHSVPSAKIVHYEGKSFEFSTQRETFAFDGKLTYYKKHFSKYYIISSCLINIIFLKFATIYLKLKKQNKENLKKYSFRLNLYKNYLRRINNE